MALVLEIEHLLGVAYAARGPDSAAPDWPPQPDRVFSALVAAWAARGERPEERAALEWLERAPTALVAASAAVHRSAPTSFVPPNDKLEVAGASPWRRRQPRRFPAALPHDATVRLVWPQAQDAPLAPLDALARDVAYVGHSASLTRCRFREADLPDAPLVPARRTVYPGRLEELEAAFNKADPHRRRRPSPGAAVRPDPAPEPRSTNVFGADWVVLEVAGGALDLRAAPLAAKALRDTLMAGYGRAGDAVPEWVSGHAADGSPSRVPHLAVALLAFAGFAHADGRLMGFAFVPPGDRPASLLDDDGFRRALFAVSRDGEGGRREVSLHGGGGLDLRLALTLDGEHGSLDPARYLGVRERGAARPRPSRTWGTVTPLVSPRHLKGGDGELEALVADACEHAGLPRPRRVVAQKHSAVAGAPSARPSGRAPRWTGWRTPERLATRTLTHAVLQFEVPVCGPVLIGAGRHCGLGLCLPLDRTGEP